jgi:hypothetical protein
MKDPTGATTPIGTQTHHRPAQRTTRGKHEPLQRRRALEGDINDSLPEMPQARPLQLRVHGITAGKTIHFTTISYTAVGKPQIGGKNHQCGAKGRCSKVSLILLIFSTVVRTEKISIHKIRLHLNYHRELQLLELQLLCVQFLTRIIENPLPTSSNPAPHPAGVNKATTT